MALPYDLYIRYLATTGLDDLKEVNQHLESLRLFPITQPDLDAAWRLIHQTLSKGVLGQLESKIYSADFAQNMTALEVEEMWRGHPHWRNPGAATDVKLILDIHQDSTLRLTLQGLLLKKVTPTEIVRILSGKFSVLLKEKHIDIYMRFFFNPCRMTRKDWKAYLNRCSAPEKRIYFIGLTESIDVLKTELELPAVISVSESLQWLLTKSFLKARNYINLDTPDANREAREWIDQVVKLTDKYEKYRSGDQNDFSKALQMEFEFINTPFDNVDSDLFNEVKDRTKPTE